MKLKYTSVADNKELEGLWNLAANQMNEHQTVDSLVIQKNKLGQKGIW